MTVFLIFIAFIAILLPDSRTDAQSWSGPTWNEFSGVNYGASTDPLDNMAYGWNRPFDGNSGQEIWWGSLEPTQGNWNLTSLNNYAASLLSWPGGSANTVPILDGNASWASSNPSTWGSDWTTYVTDVVQTLHASPYNVQYFQIWNEAYNTSNSFWPDGTWADYFNYVLNPSAKLIHQLGGKAVYGGYPSTSNSSVQDYINQLNTYNAWGNLDVLDMHYYTPLVLSQLRQAANSKGYPNLGIWETEVGNTNDEVYVANNYPRTLCWALGNSWNAVNKYKLFYFCRYDTGNNLNVYNGSTLTWHGQQLQELGRLFGPNTVSAYSGITTSISDLTGRNVDPTTTSLEAFNTGNNIIVAVHLTPTDYNANANVTLNFPFASSLVTTAERVDLTGNRVALTPTGTLTTSLTVSTHDAAGSSADTWNSYAITNKEPATFYVVLTLVGQQEANVPYNGTPATIPGVFDACNYNTGGPNVGYYVTSVNGSANSYRPDGVDLEATSDIGGGYDLGWSSNGQWFKYNVNVAAAGTYAVTFRVAALNSVSNAFHITSSVGNASSGEVNVPSTGGWQTWTTVSATINLQAGPQVLTLNQDNSGCNLNWMAFSLNKAPYGGTPASIPGVVEAENYDTGGQGVAYNQTTNGGQTVYRNDNNSGVYADSNASNGYGVGWGDAGEWLKYTINVTSSGAYNIAFRVASGASGGTFHLQDELGNNITGPVTVPATSGWSTYTTVTVNGVNLTAGLHVLTLVDDTSGFNVDSMSFTSPYDGTPWSVPGTLQAENYDTGGQGVAYNVTSINGTANNYRPNGVDLETTSDTGGGLDLGWSNSGQWFKYTVNVATPGIYIATFRVSALNAVTKAFHIQNASGTNLSGEVNVPSTGGWQTWTNVVAYLTLPAGNQTLTLAQDASGWNFNWIGFVLDNPPVTAASLNGPAGLNGWYTGPVTVTLSATAQTSSVGATYYMIDGGARQTYSTSFTVSGDASHTVNFWSIDSVGSVETTETQGVNIDGTNPVITLGTPSPAPNTAGWNNSSVSIPYTATDATSGIAITSPASPVVLSTQGSSVSQTVTATDVAGNVASASTPVLKIDTTAPTTSASVNLHTVTLSATDNLSGVGSTYYTLDGGAQQTYTSPFTVSGASQHTVNYWSVDVAGNVEATETLSIAATYTDVTSQMSVSRGVLMKNFKTGGYYQNITITNTSSASIQGPVQLVLTGLSSGVSITNASGSLNGSPYVTASTGPLAAGASVQKQIQISNPTNTAFNYSASVFSGVF
jgi:hypothetical protein